MKTRKPIPHRAALVAAATAVALAAAQDAAVAQSLESDVTPESAHLVKDSSHYAAPDLADRWLERLRFDDPEDRFSIKPGLAIDGGVMRGWWAGVNWWVTRRAKASLTYGDVSLDKQGSVGNTRTLLTRLQWIY